MKANKNYWLADAFSGVKLKVKDSNIVLDEDWVWEVMHSIKRNPAIAEAGHDEIYESGFDDPQELVDQYEVVLNNIEKDFGSEAEAIVKPHKKYLLRMTQDIVDARTRREVDELWRGFEDTFGAIEGKLNAAVGGSDSIIAMLDQIPALAWKARSEGSKQEVYRIQELIKQIKEILP